LSPDPELVCKEVSIAAAMGGAGSTVGTSDCTDGASARVVATRGDMSSEAEATPPASASAALVTPRTSYAAMMTDDESIEVGQYTWLGRILVLRTPLGNFYIGPHWYCSLIMLSFILGVGFVYVVSVASHHSIWHLAGGILVTFLSTLTFLQCALTDPGVVRLKQGLEEGEQTVQVCAGGEQGSSRRFGRRCAQCNVVQERGTSHCDFCQVCVAGHDHHCPWMGKCIGRSNARAFYTFIAVSMSSLAYIFVVTVMSGPPAPRGKF